ncbi:MAG: phosphate propanoyltransferase [bacterium]|nr:phosphate propanoyltransferase [bacterium]
MENEQLVQLIVKNVMTRLNEMDNHKIPIGVSNRHVHLSQEDLEVLFGKGYQLTKKADLAQPGQFASNETVTVRGPKGEFKNVRILGPLRKKSQVEISLTDSFRLGVKAPIKESGDLAGTPGLSLIGPVGTIDLPQGTIVALRHIHMTPAQAQAFGVKDKDIVEVETFGDRKGILGNVLVRVSDQFALEMHVDIDEANACFLKNKDYVILHK